MSQSTELSKLLFVQTNVFSVILALNIRNEGKQNTDLCNRIVICQTEDLAKGLKIRRVENTLSYKIYNIAVHIFSF